MVGCHMDVTALKEQQLRAMESEARFRALFDHANIGMCLVGPEQQTILVNQTLQSLLQYSEEELSALSLSELTHPSDQHRDQQLFRQLTLGEIPSYQTEKRYIRKDGQILWVHLSVSLVKDVYTHKPLYAIGVIRDISARKRTEQDLSKASNELEQYVYLASHDLQEPLKNILSLSATLNEEYMDKLPEEALTMLNYIQASSIRMSALISDLLNYSRIGSKKASAQIDLKQLIHNALDDLQLSIKEKKAQIILPEVIPVVPGYETDLRLLFQNLFSNALKYSKADVPPVIELKIHKIMGFWEFCLTDNGIGIDPKYHDKIFAPFKRLHNNRTFKGTGIGLAHCKKVVELHGGLIRVESMPDKGSRFIFSLQDVADHHLNHSF
jgi:PAS domain S-box-containing protein